jgi:hypothetical protein
LSAAMPDAHIEAAPAAAAMGALDERYERYYAGREQDYLGPLSATYELYRSQKTDCQDHYGRRRDVPSLYELGRKRVLELRFHVELPVHEIELVRRRDYKRQERHGARRRARRDERQAGLYAPSFHQQGQCKRGRHRRAGQPAPDRNRREHRQQKRPFCKRAAPEHGGERQVQEHAGHAAPVSHGLQEAPARRRRHCKGGQKARLPPAQPLPHGRD